MPSGLKHGRMGLRAEENLFEGIRAGLKADGFRLQAGSSGLKPEGFGFKPGSQLLEGKLQTLECEEDRMQPEEVGLEAEWELFPWEGFGSEAGTMRRDRQGDPDLLLRGRLLFFVGLPHPMGHLRRSAPTADEGVDPQRAQMEADSRECRATGVHGLHWFVMQSPSKTGGLPGQEP